MKICLKITFKPYLWKKVTPVFLSIHKFFSTEKGKNMSALEVVDPDPNPDPLKQARIQIDPDPQQW
jgi:hypothetical protein